MERVFLAEESRAKGRGRLSSEFVIAILTNEETSEAANKKAEEIALKHEARIVSAYDGDSFYRVVRAENVRAEAQTKPHTELLAIMAAILMGTGANGANNRAGAVAVAGNITKAAGL
jgi:formylmethanofuran dehydrogenase subunit C